MIVERRRAGAWLLGLALALVVAVAPRPAPAETIDPYLVDGIKVDVEAGERDQGARAGAGRRREGGARPPLEAPDPRIRSCPAAPGRRSAPRQSGRGLPGALGEILGRALHRDARLPLQARRHPGAPDRGRPDLCRDAEQAGRRAAGLSHRGRRRSCGTSPIRGAMPGTASTSGAAWCRSSCRRRSRRPPVDRRRPGRLGRPRGAQEDRRAPRRQRRPRRGRQ